MTVHAYFYAFTGGSAADLQRKTVNSERETFCVKKGAFALQRYGGFNV